jgi:hypothetical protein
MNLLPRYETSYNNALAIRCVKKQKKKLLLCCETSYNNNALALRCVLTSLCRCVCSCTRVSV